VCADGNFELFSKTSGAKTMKTLTIVLVAQVAIIASAAQAQTSVDVTKISCSQFLFDKIAPTKSIAIWLAGYYNGLHNNTVIDLGEVDEDIDKIEDYCRLHLSMTVVEAVKQALSTGK
jgi:acid stress chaperone HdeB